MDKHYLNPPPFGSSQHETFPSHWQAQEVNAACPPGLLPRVAHYYIKLQALPRRVRRALERRYARPLASLALLLALGQAPALAATINVDGTTCTLAEAIRSANTDSVQGSCSAGSGADTLVLGAGSTHTLITIEDTTYGSTGLPLVTSTITIAGNNSTIERGAGAPEFRLLAVGSGGHLALQDLALTGGRVDRDPNNDYASGTGGGIFNSGTLTLTNSTVSGNSAFRSGGVYIRSGTATLTHSTVSGNSSDFAAGGVLNAGTLTLINSSVSGNESELGTGGIANYSGTLTLTNSTVSGNGVNYGTGGIFNSGTLTLMNSTVSSNGAFSGLGGIGNSGTLTLTNSTVSSNGGGGPFSSSPGGIANYSGTLTLTNSTVSGNRTAGGSYGSGPGGIANSGGTLILAHTLISGNTSTHSDPEMSNGGTVIANDFNLFGHSGHAGVSGFSPGPTDLVPTVPIHRILAPLANNSGPTLTHALLRGSPAVDAVESGCPPPSTDQREVKRPQDGNRDGLALCDIGAFELKPTGEPPSCATAKPTQGCTVNGVPNRLCKGTKGNDTILGTPGGDVIFGLGGKDRILGRDGNDQLCGGSGNDTVRGGVGSDLIEGQAGNDRLRGENGNDVIKGGSGDDVLDGGKGNDRLDGQQNIDTCMNGERVNGCEETGS